VTNTTDRDLQREVEAELFSSPLIDETDIAVKVAERVVTLTGYVRDFVHKYGAEDAVKRIKGVVAIANDIQVLPGLPKKVTDPQIARAAVEALRLVLPQCQERIRPLIRQGSVTLEGEVDSEAERAAAEAAIRPIDGVVCVINALKLAPPTPLPDPELLKRHIEESLRTGASFDVSGITVEINSCQATLRGHVPTWPARLEAERLARDVGGVQGLMNELCVRFSPTAEGTVP
jgi:osmotically-inducible protein OsmY